MRLPRAVIRFVLGQVDRVRCVVRVGRTKWDLYLHRGRDFTLLRASLRCRPWVCSRFAGRTHSWDRGGYAEKEDFIMAFLRKLQRPEPGTLDRPDAADPKLAAAYPALCEHLCRSRDDDGKPRQTCSLTLFGASGGFRGFLNDRDSGASIAVHSESFTGLLAALEADLQSDSPHWTWRPDVDGKKGRKSGRGA